MSTRERILAAAEEVVLDHGFARATTKQIARAAGCSEALLYKHFDRKEELFLAVLLERQPHLGPALQALHANAGTGDLAKTLAEFALAAIVFYRKALPMAGGMLAEPSLLAGFREMLAPFGLGPHVPVDGLAGYLREEQRLGRVARAADPYAASAALLGACFQRAFLHLFSDLGPDEPFTTALARTLTNGLTSATPADISPPRPE
ncbi:helix-turn-helix transcriptional regulator [Streptosporangiaceae bacterium NEAU-GS5]|nr:helix-turn-helix transcriptional regulator [Streptosporangiaceae bacterium NEAU-GS5]